MKLELPHIDIQQSREFESSKFGIGNERVIMGILREKMYRDSISSCCREVMSNSRDANREAGREDTPITVKMPNQFEDNISFSDNGPGITPDRMENVFIKYGNSTKREDNVQTGGFGLGAKSPFAISDTFTIVTITQDGDKRYKRTYVAYLDKTQYGAMSNMGKEETDEPTGTTITVAVDKKDQKAFEAAVRRVGSYWKVKPNIEGYEGNWEWTEETVKFDNKADRWAVVENGNALIVIDGIAYNVQSSPIFVGTDDNDQDVKDAKKVLRSSVRFYFNVGELDVIATREDLDYTQRTIQAIRDAAKKMVDHLRKKVDTTISGCKNLWDATVEWEKVSSNYGRFILTPTWKGFELTNGYIQTGWNSKEQLDTGDFVKITIYEYESSTDKVITKKNYRKSICRSFHINEKHTLVENDSQDAPNKMRLRTLFVKGAQNVALVQFKDIGDGGKKGRDLFDKLHSFSQLGAIKLSTVSKTKNPNKDGRGKIVIHKVKKLVARRGRSGTVYDWKPENARSAEDNLGGVYVIISSGKVTLANGEVISKDSIATIQSIIGQPVYGMLYKWRKNINPAWTEVSEFTKKKIEELKKEQSVEDYLKYGWDDRAQIKLGNADYKTISAVVWKKSNLFSEWLKISHKVSVGQSKHTKLRRLCSSLHLPLPKRADDTVMRKLFQRVSEKYPLVFKSSNHYSRSGAGKHIVKEWVFYIEAKG